MSLAACLFAARASRIASKPDPAMLKPWRWLSVGLVGVIGGLAYWLTVETQRNRLVWDHFDVVKPGILYRSGQLNHDQTAEAVKRLGLRTIISFQLPGKAVEAERSLVEGLGVQFVNLPMPGDGFGREEQLREVLSLIDDPERRPILVHCARGTCRTSAAVALYRFERDGWTIEDVDAEMKRQTYRDGWLAGYVYGIVKSWPSDELPGIPARVASERTEASNDVR
jgi:protein tyrosine phosphatase (PTP) superfamily phosphohydrolase (DUF442 family)